MWDGLYSWDQAERDCAFWQFPDVKKVGEIRGEFAVNARKKSRLATKENARNRTAADVSIFHNKAAALADLGQTRQRLVDAGLFLFAGGKVCTRFGHNLFGRGGCEFRVVQAATQTA